MKFVKYGRFVTLQAPFQPRYNASPAPFATSSNPVLECSPNVW
jgi:hypothetical protein